MVVRTITDEENGKRWDIIKHEENRYDYAYYEYYKSIGWKRLSTDRGYTKDCIMFMFNLLFLV
jgi:hypothetical protein